MPLPAQSQRLRIIVEGWRLLAHSYAVVNQFQCLELLRRAHVELRHRDMPFYAPHWRQVSGLWDPSAERALRDIPAPGPGEFADAILRIDYPHRLNPVPGIRTCVYATSEYRCLPVANIAGGRPLAQWHRESDVLLITPSQWSRRGLVHSGADPARVFVVPHGIDPGLFHSLSPGERTALRGRLGLEGFIFLNLSGMFGNKNIGMLLKAFAAVAARHPHARLALKGNDMLFASEQLVEQSRQGLTPAEIQLVQPRLTYTGKTLSFRQVRELYQAMDAYVSPYAAEGFNLPVLEAAACGMPVICTAGGSTDDFTSADFALPVAAKEQQVMVKEAQGWVLVPSLDSLIVQMTAAIENPDFTALARIAGPRFVANGFLWSQVVDRLLQVLSSAQE
jgi:glycosyltransferase involved in cell wall biosynthesis